MNKEPGQYLHWIDPIPYAVTLGLDPGVQNKIDPIPYAVTPGLDPGVQNKNDSVPC